MWVASASKVAGLVVLLSVVLAASASAHESNYFGVSAISYSDKTMKEFSTALTTSHAPMLLIVYDGTNTEEVGNIWQRLIPEVSEALKLFTIRTAYATAGSAVGRALVDGFGIGVPSILFFDGLLRPLPNGQQGFGKIPVGYVGDVSVPELVRWTLKNVSPDLITRVEGDDDLLELFAKFPGFPDMPRVLYFTDRSYVSPVMRLESQVFQADAVMGSVVRPFDTEAKASIAMRYGINDRDDLPAIVVLRPQSYGSVDDVVRLPDVNAKSTVEDIAQRLREELPNCAMRAMEHLAATGDNTLVNAAHRRKIYVLEELARYRVDMFGEDADDPLKGYAAGSGQTGSKQGRAEPTTLVVTKQQEWKSNCAHMRQGHYCLAVVAEKTETDKAKTVLQQAAGKIMKSLPLDMEGRVHFVVLDAERSSAIQEFFEVGQHGLPDTVLVTATHPRMYYNFIGSYSADNLVRFFLSKTQVKKPTGGARFIAHMVPALADEPPRVNNSDADYDADL